MAGVLSGTSADGIDVALSRFEPALTAGLGRPIGVAFRTVPFEAALAEQVRALLDGKSLELGQLARLDRDLGRAFGAAARQVAQEEGLEIELIASHGQTVWHHDGSSGGPATLQLGDGCELSEVAECTVVSDFRTRDIAAGGEGAPLLAAVEAELFPRELRPLCVLNLGGISNLTWLPEAKTPTLAFDTGPAGCLLDGLARRLLDRPMDRAGAAASRGTASEELVRAWGKHAFFELSPPRSTGRDTFGEAWIDGLIRQAPGSWSAEDSLRTAVEFVAECVARGLREFLPESSGVPMAVAGGGVHNETLMEALQRRCSVRVAPASEFGVNPDAREALGFAILGARQVLGLPSTSRGITGAMAGRVLGKLSLDRGALDGGAYRELDR